MGCGCGKNNEGKKTTQRTLSKEQADAIAQAAGEKPKSRRYEKLKQLLDRGDIDGYKKVLGITRSK